MNNIYSYCCFIAILMLAGCGTAKKATEGDPVAGEEHLLRRDKDRAAFLESVKASELDFDWFAARGKAEIASGGKNYQVSLNLRMQRDKVIWASVTAILGLEVARAMITPDSVFFFNRLERTYVSQDLEYLQEHVHPGISFELLQSALTGNPPAYLVANSAQLWQTAGGYRLEGTEQLFTYLLNFNEHRRPAEIAIRQKDGTADFNVDYSNFENRNGKWVPGSLSFLSDTEKEDLKIQITYDTFVLNEPQRFPFAIPGQYERMQ